MGPPTGQPPGQINLSMAVRHEGQTETSRVGPGGGGGGSPHCNPGEYCIKTRVLIRPHI